MVDVKMYPQVYTEIEPLWYKILCVFSMLVNIILMLISIALLGLGVWFQITANDYINYGDHGTWSIAIAGLVFLVSAMGCCAVSNRNTFLTKVVSLFKSSSLLWLH